MITKVTPIAVARARRCSHELKALTLALYDWRALVFCRYAPDDPASWYRALRYRHQDILDNATAVEELIR